MNVRQTRLTPTTILVLAGTILIATVMGVLFSQAFTFPTSTPAPVTANCATVTTSTASVVTGSGPATLLFKCGTNPAFTSTAATATPTFTLPTGLTGVGYTQDSASPTCPGTSLTSGTSVSFTAGLWDYCVSYTSYPASPPSLTVAWA